MNYLILASLPIVFGVGLWIGRTKCQKENKAKWEKRKAQHQIEELFGQYAVLETIRNGQTEKAVEFMEFSADLLVPMLSRQLPKTDSSTQNHGLITLTGLKSYRQSWPRQPRPELLASDDLPNSRIQEAAEEAKRILNNLQHEPLTS